MHEFESIFGAAAMQARTFKFCGEQPVSPGVLRSAAR
jgi:hypothetical protein